MLKFKKETEFKQTEIGEVPREWEVKELKEVALVNKKIGKSDDFNEIFHFISMEDIPTDGKYPFFKEVDYSDIKSGIEVFPGQILLAKITPSFEHGKMCVVPEITGKWFSTTEVFTIYPKNENKDSKWYLYYMLKEQNLRDILEGSMTGTSGRQRVQLSALKSLSIPYPPLPEQSRIATVLSWFDDLIENKKRQNEILEKTAMAIFKSWFVDFEPFKDGEFVYNEELGKEIPEEWEVKKIGDVAEFIKGLSYKGSEKFYEKPNQKSFVFITLDNILRKGGFKTEYTWVISDRLKERHFLTEGDLIMANTDMTQNAEVIGSPAIVIFPYDYKREIGVYSHHITKIHLRNSISKYYLYLFLKDTQSENTTFSTGTNVLGLDISNFKQNKLILLPPQPILQKFHSLVEPLFRKIILNQKEIMVLRKVRDALLPQLVFGKLRVVEL